MIGYDKRGVVFALTEGSELLLHDGETEGPLWRKTLDGKIIGVAASSARVLAITDAGTITAFGARSGDVQRTIKLAGRPRAVVADAVADRVVAATADQIVEVHGDAQTTLADHSAKRLALRDDGGVLAATDTDELVVLAGGKRTASHYDGVTIVALAYHPGGFWVLGLPGKLLRWDGSAAPSHITNMPKGETIADVACSERAIAITLAPKSVAVLAWPSKDTLGSLDYVDKEVEGIAFGPWPWLGVSLSLGDGNKLNLAEGSVNRSDTHPGREHHRWLVRVGGGEPPAAPAPRPSAPAPAPARGLAAPNPARTVLLVVLAAAALAGLYFAVH